METNGGSLPTEEEMLAAAMPCAGCPDCGGCVCDGCETYIVNGACLCIDPVPGGSS